MTDSVGIEPEGRADVLPATPHARPGRPRRSREHPRGIAVLAHVLLGFGVLGIAMTAVLAAPYDPEFTVLRVPGLMFGLLTVVVGWILAWKRPRVPIGWLMLVVVGLIGFLQGPATAIAAQLRTSDPIAAGWALQFGRESTWTWILVLGSLLALVPLRFPTGRLPSPGWAGFWWLSIVVLVVDSGIAATFGPTMEFILRTASGAQETVPTIPNPMYVRWGAALGPLQAVLELSLAAVFIGALASLFVRYRRADGVERAQLRWFFWALATVVGLLVVGGVESAAFGGDDAEGVAGFVATAFDFVSNLASVLLPLSILVAMLRSGLYAIDRIISRTAAYTVTSLGVVAGYVAVVLVGSLVPQNLAGVGVAATTLAAAAVFFPLLRVVRRAIDHRFDRAQYDAQKVVDAFGERIRSGADPYSAGEDFVAAVQLALQPSAIGIWRRETAP